MTERQETWEEGVKRHLDWLHAVEGSGVEQQKARAYHAFENFHWALKKAAHAIVYP